MSASKNKGLITFKTAKAEEGLKAAVKKKRSDIIAEISDSKLKGRGGAGFPTGVKWNLAGAAKCDKKCVICNADEGEPGTFKDKVILKECPDLVFEGMTIAAKAINVEHGILYLRAEYSYLRPALEDVLAKRRKANLLGKAILGEKDFNFDIEIRMGAGAYVCGEETALIESLEGNRGEPRNRPPFPVDTGYMGCPTVVNNVETLCWAAMIMQKGASWFKKIGTDKSKGAKIFSISGDCAEPGVYEFPMGIKISELLREVGGEGAKAVQVGGASGRCVPAGDFEHTIAFEDIPTGGSIIIFGPDRDMLDVAQNFMQFFLDESCGQCTPCREGNRVLMDGITKLKAGRCPMSYLKELLSLSETMALASKCGLGQTSPSAFVSIVENFSDEIMGRMNSH
jgi:[NiFe] hydrogenase diaphorase moiety large subunit